MAANARLSLLVRAIPSSLVPRAVRRRCVVRANIRCALIAALQGQFVILIRFGFYCEPLAMLAQLLGCDVLQVVHHRGTNTASHEGCLQRIAMVATVRTPIA